MGTKPRVPIPPDSAWGTASFNWTGAFPDWVGKKWKELLQLAGIPATSEGSLQFDAVIRELCRIMNAQTQGCVF